MMPTDFAKGKAWAIVPEAFEALARKFAEFQNNPDFKPRLAAAQKSMSAASGDPKPYSIENVGAGGVAVIPVVGPLTKRLTFWSWLMGGSTYAALSDAFRFALSDPEVAAIVLSIDSPGGTVNGVEAVSDLIYAARDKKPVVAYADGLMASAAYWLGSGASAIVAGNTAEIGSIGVLMVHQDYSVADANAGVKITYLTAGKYKALGNDAEPLSREARDVFQAQLDKYYDIFTAAIARNRGADQERVLSDMADGRIFIGDNALAAGLVDRIGSLSDAVASATDMIKQNKQKRREIMKIETIEQLTEAYPDLIKAVIEKARSEADAAASEKKGAAVERKRILSLAGVQFGKETADAFARIVETGVTIDQLTAIRQASPMQAAAPAPEAEAVKRAKEEMLAAIQNANPDNPGAWNVSAASGSKDFMAMVAEYRAIHKCGVEIAMKAVVKANPAAHKAYIAKAN